MTTKSHPPSTTSTAKSQRRSRSVNSNLYSQTIAHVFHAHVHCVRQLRETLEKMSTLCAMHHSWRNSIAIYCPFQVLLNIFASNARHCRDKESSEREIKQSRPLYTQLLNYLNNFIVYRSYLRSAELTYSLLDIPQYALLTITDTYDRLYSAPCRKNFN